MVELRIIMADEGIASFLEREQGDPDRQERIRPPPTDDRREGQPDQHCAGQ